MKILKRILIGVLALIVAAIVFAVGSVVVDGALMGGRVAAIANTLVQLDNRPDVRAYVARPSTPGPHPAVIMVHEFWGLTDDIARKADALAAEGYVVIAPSAFRERTTSWVPSAIYNVVSIPAEQIDSDIETAFRWLEAQPEVDKQRIGIMGFCFGGGTSLRYSLSNPRLAATVVFYGQLVTDPERLRALPGPVLGIFGGADQAPSPEQAKAFQVALDAAGKKSEITIYDGQPHAFVRSPNPAQAGGAQAEAWAQLLRFLNASLKAKPATAAPGGVARADGIASWDLRYVLALAAEHLFTQHAH